MHNVNVDALNQTVAAANADPSAVAQSVRLDGEWQTEEGRPQFRATIPFPAGEMNCPGVWCLRNPVGIETHLDAPPEPR